MTIDLDDHRTGGSIVFSGRERGKAVRRDTKLSEVDIGDESIHILIPDDIITITSSFVLGLLGPTFRALGNERARQDVQFEGPINETAIDDAIKEALKGDRPISE